MKKTVSIQEAIKANEHSRVRLAIGDWFEVGQIASEGWRFDFGDVLAEWEIEAKPLELYINIDSDEWMAIFKTKEEAEKFSNAGRIRCVKMREVVE